MPDAQPALTRLADLDGDPRWAEFPIPDSAPPTRLLRLAVDRATKASVSVVRFPPGWSRPGSGHYPVGEEFAVLDGELQVSGVRHRAGDIVYLPPGTTRSASQSAQGALAVAWFSGVPHWHAGTGDDCQPGAGAYAGRPVPGPLRGLHAGVPGSSLLADPLGPEQSEVDRDVLWLESQEWAWVPAGERPPQRPGVALVRRWA